MNCSTCERLSIIVLADRAFCEICYDRLLGAARLWLEETPQHKLAKTLRNIAKEPKTNSTSPEGK